MTETVKHHPTFVRVDDEPLHVRRWKSEHVRLVDVQFPPQTTSLWHQHVHYGVYIAITPIHSTEQSIYDEQPKQLAKNRGEVFCRDHTKDRLTHVVTTMEQPMRIIEVELVRDERLLAIPNDKLPVHDHASIQRLHEDHRCRVYRITLTRETAHIDVVLPSHAVIVALHECSVAVLNDSVDPTVQQLTRGDDIQLAAGKFTLMATELNDADVAEFILTEVY